MEISAIEIQLLCQRISESVSEYFLSGIYSIESGILLRLGHSSKPEKLIAISSFAPWITTKNLSFPQASKFVSRLREEIERFWLISVNQVGNERIAKFVFKGKKGEERNLYTEFFAHGNIILTDAQKKETILYVENAQAFRHRSLSPGQEYTLPPSRGIPLQEVDENRLISIFESSAETLKSSNLPSIKWFGRNVGTSRKFVEEIFWKSRVDPETPARNLTNEQLAMLANACKLLIIDLKESLAGHVLIPNETVDLEVDICPIIPHSWKESERKELSSIKSYASLSEALDEVQIQALVVDRQRQASLQIRAKTAELDSAIARQKLLIGRNIDYSEDIRKMAASLLHTTEAGIGNDLVEKLQSYELVEESNGQLRLTAEPRTYLGSFSPSSLASRLFDEAKRLEATNRKLNEVILDLESQREALSEQTKSREGRVGKNIITERRERQWYERYRWFLSSDRRLVIGGRDSTSNSIVINKYTRKNDVVFHADLHGSPFLVLKNVSKQPPEEGIALELAQATVSFSRAWKDELGSADAYWIFPEQIKKSAPSGEYLPRGSFFIEGKKNFVRHVKVELSVGVALASNLPGEEGFQRKDGEDTLDQVVVVCGPDRSIANYCISQVRIAPGKEKSSDLARRLKQELVSRAKDEKYRVSVKKLSIDEIIRAFPSGGLKIVSEKHT